MGKGSGFKQFQISTMNILDTKGTRFKKRNSPRIKVIHLRKSSRIKKRKQQDLGFKANICKKQFKDPIAKKNRKGG
eukprot:snap_masked-scaffold_18-processed-gene-1.45-mRNA-1 protein AED:1.00 eAED:1.00 QI:0/-1/0/0/-1/1/1/0/75